MEAVQAERPAYPYRVHGRCIVLAHGDRPPSDAEFTGLIDELVRVAEVQGSARLLVYAAGDGAPNAKQRASLRRLASSPIRVGILSDSKVVRAIVTAVSWILKQRVDAFPTGDASAIAFLELEPQEQVAVRRLLAQVCLEGGLPLPKLSSAT